MRKLKDIALHPYVSGAYGAKIEADEVPQPVGSVLPAATAQNVAWAALYWPQSSEQEFE